MPTKTPTQTPGPPALSPARARLQEILEAKKRAIALVDKAAAVVEAANAAVEQARAEAVKCDAATEDVIKIRLRALKGEEPAKSPDQIREARRNRLLAKEELTAADETLRAAQQELEQAQGNVARTQRVAASHVTATISESASDVISLWDTVSEEGGRLRTILNSLIMTPNVALDALPQQQQVNIIQGAVSQAQLPFGDAQDWKHLQNKVGAALGRNYAQRDPGPGIARAREYWKQFADAVIADPTAEQAPLPSSDALFD